MMTYQEMCEDQCARKGIVLTDDERVQIAEMEAEGLMPFQAPDFIAAQRGLRVTTRKGLKQ